MFRFLLFTLLLVILGLSSGKARAQDSSRDTDTLTFQYWFLRDRMVSDFMLGVGPAQGHSLIGYRRNLDNSLKFGDNTIKLGHYLSILATEHALLSKNGQDLLRTSKELYYALYAVNRLDLEAERYFKGPDGKRGTPSLNGFMLRDDVAPVTPEQLLKLNTDPSLVRVERVKSDYLDTLRGPFINTPSQDQVIYLLAGLALIVQLVPDNYIYSDRGLIFEFQDGEVSFRKEAIRIIERLVSYLYTPPWSWNLINPVTGSVIPPRNGGSALSLSWGFAQVMEKWTGSSLKGVGEMSGMYENLFDSYKRPIIFRRVQKSGEGDKILMLAAISDAWGDESFEKILAFSKDKKGIYEFDNIPLVYQLLYPNATFKGWNTELERVKYHDMLLRLPCGTGPYHYGNASSDPYPDYEWSANDRIVEPEQRGHKGKAHWYGDFSGFDWMLYHNLYRLVFNDMTGFTYTNYLTRGPAGPEEDLFIRATPNTVLARPLYVNKTMVLEGISTDTVWVEAACSGLNGSLICKNGSTTVIKGLTMVFKAGSSLILEEGSHLILKEGATIWFEDDALKQFATGSVVSIDASSRIVGLEP